MRSRLALIQGAQPNANVPRSLVKELNCFFIGEARGWRTLWSSLSATAHEMEETPSSEEGHNSDGGQSLGGGQSSCERLLNRLTCNDSDSMIRDSNHTSSKVV